MRGYDGSWYNFKGIGKVPLNQEGREDYINALTNLIDKAKIKQDVWLSRGWESSAGAAGFLNISTQEFNKLSSLPQKKLEAEFVGKVFFDPAFVSCGSVKGSGFHGSLVGNIYAPKGARAIYAEPFSHYNGDSMSEKRPWDGKSKYSYGTEFETLIQRGTSFRCTKAYFDNGQLYMDFEIISQNKF